jgi:nicotinamidase-related amidase
LKERLVAVEANDDGTAGLYGMQLPAADTHAAIRRINRLARAARAAWTRSAPTCSWICSTADTRCTPSTGPSVG